MPHTVVSPEVSGYTADEASACGACAHPRSSHDRIATRFCSATDAGGFSRGCVCTPFAGDAASGKETR